MRVAGGFGCLDKSGCGGHHLVRGPDERKCDDQAGPSRCVSVATACELGAVPLDGPFGLAGVRVGTSEPVVDAVGHLVAVIADNRLPGVAVADRSLDPSC